LSFGDYDFLDSDIQGFKKHAMDLRLDDLYFHP